MDVAREKQSTHYEMSFERSSEETLLIRLVGSWETKLELPSVDEVRQHLESGSGVRHVTFDTEGLTSWDSGLLTFLIKVIDLCDRSKISIEKKGLPMGVQSLLSLAAAVPEKKDAHKGTEGEPFLSNIGAYTLKSVQSVGDMLDFIGGACLAFIKMLGGKARFRRSDLVLLIQECGVQALPIVSLISFLVGLILAFMGAVQLKMFGAQIYVADMVGIAMTREMGAMMTGIIMAGRTGAAFAAQLGTMQVNEEIDALTTMGISPMEFLVLPRMLALILMMPLLTLYADLVGIIGGAVVGIGMLDISFTQYLNQTQGALNMTYVAAGVFKSIVYGVLIALSGCLQGMLCGRSASAVGNATTSAVVMAIILIIVSDGIFAVVSNALGV
jgi:phospholipid/cholesterol/gamma-HCH transport system permease protein